MVDISRNAIATIVSGVFFVFDFGLGMGPAGAGLATAIGERRFNTRKREAESISAFPPSW